MGDETPSRVTRLGRRVGRTARRAATSPFADRGDRPLIVHCGHHKAGTVWFRRTLLDISQVYGLRYRAGMAKPVAPDADVVVYANTREYDRADLGDRPFRGSHLIRDPRDLVVSGYEYHLITDEAWAKVPRDAYGGLSYQDHLRSLDEQAGLMAEIDWFLPSIGAEMLQWDYTQPEFMELRYEEVLADEHGAFDRLFRWYGFDDRAVSLGHDVVERRSRRNGGARASHPIRAADAGEWRSRLTPAHVEHFKAASGDLLIRLGYEAGDGW